MSVPLLILMFILQIGVSIDQALKHNWAIAIMFFSYAIANVAYIFVIK